MSGGNVPPVGASTAGAPRKDYYDPNATLADLFGDLKGLPLLEAIWTQYQARPDQLRLAFEYSQLCGGYM